MEDSKKKQADSALELRFSLPHSIKSCWMAVGNAEEYGYWFGSEFEGPFLEGRKVSAKIAATQVDQLVAEKQQPLAGIPYNIWISKMRKYSRFSFLWQPAVPGADTNPELRIHTEVEFLFRRGFRKTWVRIRESGFEKLPTELREKVLAENKRGWEIQSGLLSRYLEQKHGH